MKEIQEIALERLYPSEGNRRIGGFDEQKLQQLADSIKAVGVQQPAVVRLGRKAAESVGRAVGVKVEATELRYEIVAGERRWKAATLAGLATLPCVIRELDDVTVIKIQTIENLQREDIHPLDEDLQLRQSRAAPGTKEDDKVKRVCCGCGHEMGIAPGPEDQVTHGLCELCVEWIHLPESLLRSRLVRLEQHVARRQRPAGKEAGRHDTP